MQLLHPYTIVGACLVTTGLEYRDQTVRTPTAIRAATRWWVQPRVVFRS